MDLHIPDEITRRAELGASELLTALAVQLYAENQLDYEDACRLSSLSSAAFTRELLERQLSVQKYATRRSAG